jgi:hypothetical protein
MAKKMCRKAWTDFDTLSMTNGLVFALLALLSWAAVCTVQPASLPAVFQPALLILLALGSVVVSAGLVSVQLTHWMADNWAWSAIFATSCGTQALTLSSIAKQRQQQSRGKKKQSGGLNLRLMDVTSVLFSITKTIENGPFSSRKKCSIVSLNIEEFGDRFLISM